MIIVVYSTQYKPMNDDVDDDHDNYTLKLVLVRLTALALLQSWCKGKPTQNVVIYNRLYCL